MIENFTDTVLRMRAKGWKVVLHPQECGPCHDCKRLINTMADKIAMEEDDAVMREMADAQTLR